MKKTTFTDFKQNRTLKTKRWLGWLMFCMMMVFGHVGMAQSVDTQTFSANGVDSSSSTQLMVTPGDITVNGTDAILGVTISDFSDHYNSAAGGSGCYVNGNDWFSFNLTVVGGAADGTDLEDICGDSMVDLDVTGFTSITITTNDTDWYSDMVYFNLTLEVTYGVPPTCPAPTALSATGVATTSATLNWTGTGNNYDIEIVPAAQEPTGTPTNTGVNSPFTTTTPLTPATAYKFYVRENCGGGDLSDWAGPFSFTTLCVPVSTLPYIENFDSYGTGSDAFPVCWERPVTHTYLSVLYPSIVSGTSTSSPHSLRMMADPSTPTYAITPAFTEDINNLRVTFQLRREGANSGTVDFGVMSDPSDLSTFELVETIDPSNTSFNEYVFYLNETTLSGGNNHIAFKHNSNFNNWYIWIDDFVVDEIPSCIEVQNATLNWVTKNSAELSWSPTVTSPTASYIWEVRTSGDPGSGAVGLAQSGTTASGVTTAEVNGLTPSTDYQFYVRANCGDDDLSPWNELGINFITLCDYPDLVEITSDVICGIGSASLLANFTDNSTVNWYAQAEGGESLFTGTNFTTPLVDTTTIYYVDATSAVPYTRVQVGEGASTANSYQNPFYSLWSNSHTQYLITAEELIAAGLTTGNIYSVALDITSAGTLPMKDLSVKIGTTTATDMTTFVDNTNFATVYTNSSLMPETGVNILTFNTPFVWDGTSNIVLEFCHGNESSTTTMSRTTRADATDYVSVIKTHKTSSTAGSVICGDTTSNVATYSLRPVFIFNDTELCTSPRIPVEVVVTPSEDFTLEVDQITVCQGNYTEPIFIEAGDDVYDTYTWYPSEFVTGDEENGFVFFGNTSTLYTVIASQSDGECAKAFEIQVNVSSLGYEPLEESYIVCADGVQALSIYPNEIDVSVLPYETLRYYTFEGNTMGDLTLTNANGSTLHYYTDAASEGNTSLRWEYANTSGVSGLNPSAHLETGTLDASGSYGLLVEFDNVSYMENCCDFGYLMYSLDGGINWEVFTPEMYYGEAAPATHATYPHIRFKSDTYSDWGNPTSGVLLTTNDLWKREVFMIPAEGNDLSNVKIRFAVRSDVSSLRTGWYLDNIQIKKVDLPEVEWSPVQHLYLDEELTQPYAGESVGTVYFNHTSPGNFAYTATVSNDMINCTAVIETEVVIPELIFPGLTNMYYCDTVSVDDLEFEAQNGVQYIWYQTIAATDPIDQISTSGVYFVQIVTDQCTSSRQPVQVAILTGVNVTVETTQYACEGNTITSLLATPSQPEGIVQWFSSATSTTPLSPNTQLLNGATYYVNQNLFGCESTRIPVTVQVSETPDPITTDEIFVCANTTIANISIDGQSNLHWYTSPTSNVPLASQAILTSGVYYVATYVNVCDSQRIPVEVTVVPFLPQIQSSVIDICGVRTIADLETSINGLVEGAQLEWYASSTSTTPLASDEVLYTGTYYAVQRISDCTSTRRAIAVRVNSKSAPIINSQQVCQGTTISEVQITAPSGVTFQWYSSPTATNALAPSTVLTSTTYYVKRVQNGCVSEAAPVQVVINEVPTAPTGEALQVLEQGSTIEDIVVNQQNVVWYITEQDALNGINPLQPFMPLVDGQTYYGVIINAAGCASAPLAVTVELFLGLNDLDVASLKVYPNPTSDILNVSYKESIDKLEVYSMLGQIVKTEKGFDREVSVDLSGLSAGTYMIKIYVGQHSQLVKVVKK